MAQILCYQPVFDEEDGSEDSLGPGHWEPVSNPRFFHAYDNTMVLEIPRSHEATCNGLPVVGGIQVVSRGDLIWIGKRNSKRQWRYSVGMVLPDSEPGGERLDDLTGMPIRGQATRCQTCGALYATETIAQTGLRCADCQTPLCDQVVSAPPLETL